MRMASGPPSTSRTDAKHASPEQVKSTGLLKLLGAKSEAGGSIADVLGKGDVDRDQEKAFQGVGGVGVASADSLRGIKSGGSGSGRVADAGSLRGGAGIAGSDTGKGAGERTVKGAIKTEAPAVDAEAGTASFDIHYCPHEDVYGAFDCRVQRYFVEGMIAAGRRRFGRSMFDVRFTSTIPSGSRVCHFDMFPKSDQTSDAWNEYSERLRERALSIVEIDQTPDR